MPAPLAFRRRADNAFSQARRRKRAFQHTRAIAVALCPFPPDAPAPNDVSLPQPQPLRATARRRANECDRQAALRRSASACLPDYALATRRIFALPFNIKAMSAAALMNDGCGYAGRCVFAATSPTACRAQRRSGTSAIMRRWASATELTPCMRRNRGRAAGQLR